VRSWIWIKEVPHWTSPKASGQVRTSKQHVSIWLGRQVKLIYKLPLKFQKLLLNHYFPTWQICMCTYSVPLTQQNINNVIMISFIHKSREVPFDGRHCSNWCHSNLPKVRVHAFYFSALQLISGLVLGASDGWLYELLHCLAKKGHVFLLLEIGSKHGVKMLPTGNLLSHKKRVQ
jgi:hypothetical protein